EVATATGPAQALDAIGLQGFDLVLCDIGMPGQSGLDMPRALRERGYAGKLVLMTGWDSHALSADPRLAECDTLLKKPFVDNEHDVLHVTRPSPVRRCAAASAA